MRRLNIACSHRELTLECLALNQMILSHKDVGSLERVLTELCHRIAARILLILLIFFGNAKLPRQVFGLFLSGREAWPMCSHEAEARSTT